MVVFLRPKLFDFIRSLSFGSFRIALWQFHFARSLLNLSEVYLGSLYFVFARSLLILSGVYPWHVIVFLLLRSLCLSSRDIVFVKVTDDTVLCYHHLGQGYYSLLVVSTDLLLRIVIVYKVESFVVQLLHNVYCSLWKSDDLPTKVYCRTVAGGRRFSSHIYIYICF